MAPRHWIFLLFLALCYCHVEASHFLSRQAIALADSSGGNELHNTANRHLLQTKKQCTVNFQVQNYSILTSVCKGPYYPKKACCNGFVVLACPFAAEINDGTTNCADQLFNYINYYGHYPAGLFANECVGNDLGLPCPPTSAPLIEVSHAFQSRRCSTIFLWLLWLCNIVVVLDWIFEGRFVF